MNGFGNNLLGQEQWERRGENAARLRALETGVALVQTGAWTVFAPVITQGVTITHTDTYSRWIRSGRHVTWNFSVALTSAGTGGSAVGIGLPVAAVNVASTGVGAGQFYKASTATRYICVFELASGGSSLLLIHETSGGNVFGAAPAVTIANGDSVRGTVTYEAAS